METREEYFRRKYTCRYCLYKSATLVQMHERTCRQNPNRAKYISMDALHRCLLWSVQRCKYDVVFFIILATGFCAQKDKQCPFSLIHKLIALDHWPSKSINIGSAENQTWDLLMCSLNATSLLRLPNLIEYWNIVLYALRGTALGPGD